LVTLSNVIELAVRGRLSRRRPPQASQDIHEKLRGVKGGLDQEETSSV
jgi:hypothetical protein